MNVRRLIRTTATAGAVVLGLTAVAACSSADSGSGSGSGGEEGGKLKVTASFYPMQFLAERIGGEHVSVTALTKPGVEPHDLELKPRQAAQLGESGYILYLKGLQPAVDKAIEQSGVKHTVDAATLTSLETHQDEKGHEDKKGHEGHDHAAEESHDDHGHDHGSEAGDPHIWLDPAKYAEVAKGVGASLEKADPKNADAYRKNTATLVGELNKLDADYREGLKKTATKTFITTHTSFGHLAERYGLDQEGIAGINPDAEPSPARIKELQTIAEKDRVTTVFFDTLASDRTAKTLADDTGLTTDVLDSLEGITDKSRGSDYLEVMESNLTALKKALGAS
ncbi:zinc ABC transporter substrate-binding protein [Streptomyces amakusaensis]|uniref:Metal ABC transporter substrate-binding protein n=1 Tax=Streptomyces amakusaensis TaxID=67271 RepID=A0ABW0AB27_9ACTN